MSDQSKDAEAAVSGMGNPDKAAETAAAEAAVLEPAPRLVPEFMWEIDQNGCLVLLADFFTNLKGKRRSACQQNGLQNQR